MEIWIVFLVIICPIWVTLIAADKNRDKFFWFFGGLLFNIVALCLIYSLPRLAGNKQCVKCKSIIHEDAEICPYCKSEIHNEATIK